MTRKTADQFMLRLPENWREKVKEEAAKCHHSMNSEILNAIQTAMRIKGVQLDVPAQK
ncbi:MULTISPECIES: Arc family DNA-binding protein [unclassified Phaeobacter]|uniref:Arc family DNA-binding protein n=1 Tax=unclassified Phaeobacter TaxID=2621772 RepID=UPI003A8C7292